MKFLTTLALAHCYLDVLAELNDRQARVIEFVAGTDMIRAGPGLRDFFINIFPLKLQLVAPV